MAMAQFGEPRAGDRMIDDFIGVARIFDWGGGKPQITCNDINRNFKRETFCGAKIS